MTAEHQQLLALVEALRTLHYSIEHDLEYSDGGLICAECSGFDVVRHPCQTLQTIETVLLCNREQPG